jgi:prepilin-type N-terminal cleavage/methylation domain-containing protein
VKKRDEYCKGFTLIELMIVICLFCFLATLTLLNVSFLDSTIVHTELDKLATFCYYLQQKAIATNKEIILTFDTKKNEYTGDTYHEKLSSRVSFGFFDNAQGPPGQPIGPINKAITFPAQRIHFYPTGIISSGTVYLMDKTKKSMYALSNAVSQLSYIRMYRYDGSWKVLKL